eukprot:jgi/Chrzof1/3974/Cz13g15180.t1
MDLLDRCGKVEDVLQKDEPDIISSATAEARPQSALASKLRAAPVPTNRAPKQSKMLVREAQKLLSTVTHLASEANHAAAAAPHQQQQHRPAAVPLNLPSTPLSTVLAQYKDAQAAWAREKAGLRREAVTQRKRATKLEQDYTKLERLHAHKTLDVQTLRNALKGRDVQLQEADAEVKRLQAELQRSKEAAAEQLCELAGERDDLQALLLATLDRLEAVEGVAKRADESSLLMEQKVRALEQERLSALESAAAARAEVKQLREARKRLQWQSSLLEKMAEVQLRHNKRKSEAIKELLGGCGVRTNHQHDHDADGDDAEGEDDGRHDDCGLSSVSESAASGIEEAASLIRELAAATGTADD